MLKGRKSKTHKISLGLILFAFNLWERFKEKYNDALRVVEIENVERFRKCRDPGQGCSIFKCPNCDERKYIPFTCKSRICTSCGNKMLAEWSDKIFNRLKNVYHRHIVLTIPKILTEYLADKHCLLKVLFKAGQQTMKDMIMYSSKPKRRLKIGLILVLQTYGKDLSWNIHLHGIVTEGGYGKNNDWIDVNFINYDSWRKKWQYEVLINLKKEIDASKENNIFIDTLFKRYRNGFVIYGKRRFHKKNAKNVIKYVGRYVRHPPISESRIHCYKKGIVVFWYREPETDEKIYVELEEMEFIRRLLSHIPEKYFKIARCYGIYGRRAKKIIQIEIEEEWYDTRESIGYYKWRKMIIRVFNRDPLICDKCGHEMEYDGRFYCNDDWMDYPNDRPPPHIEKELDVLTNIGYVSNRYIVEKDIDIKYP